MTAPTYKDHYLEHLALAVKGALVRPDAVISFEIPRDMWLTANRHISNHRYLAVLRSHLHGLAMSRARAEGLRSFESAVLVWHVAYPKGTSYRRGDPANALPTTKSLLDGLVKAGVFPDDSPAYVRLEATHRAPNLQVRSLHTITLHIKEMNL